VNRDRPGQVTILSSEVRFSSRGSEERRSPADYLTMPVGTVDQRDAEQRRLAAESEELLQQSSVLAHPQSQAFRDYLDRLYLHTTKLSAFVSEIPAGE
jgi:hypothetical protein